MASAAARHFLLNRHKIPSLQPTGTSSLCSRCRLMTTDLDISDAMHSDTGYKHSHTGEMMISAYAGCPFCFFIYSKVQSKVCADGGMQFEGGDVFVSVMQSKANDSGRRIVIGMKYQVMSQSSQTRTREVIFGEDFVSLDPGLLEVFAGKPESQLFYYNADVEVADVKGEVLTQHVKHLLDDCRNTHDQCSRRPVSNLPPRVLDVGLLSDDLAGLKLHISQEGEKAEYVALSYCWGTQSTVTTKDTINANMKSIDIDTLPKTIQDAITTTRQLRIRYLWVDALCIIQDDLEGKATEIDTMGQVYGNATLTIVAASARSSADGFLWPRITSPTFHLPLPRITIEMPLRSLEFRLDVRVEPLNSRGWTLQELLLSHRLLIYQSDDVYWLCQKENLGIFKGGEFTQAGKLSQTLTSQKHTPVETGGRTLTTTLLNPQDPSPDSKISQTAAWVDTIEQFTARQLTFPEDSLPAVAGVAKSLSTLWNDTYLAGLWKRSIISLLPWAVNKSSTRHASGARRGPSWSWSSIYAPVTFDIVHVEKAEFVSCSVLPVSQRAPFGQVWSGSLVVRAEMVEAYSVTKTYPESVVALDDGSVMTVKPDPSLQEVVYMFLGNHRTRGGRGLVLKRVSEAAYARVGRISIRPGWETWKKDQKWSEETITIV